MSLNYSYNLLKRNLVYRLRSI